MEGEAIGCGVTGTTDIADTEEGKEGAEIWFGTVDQFKWSCERIIDFEWKIVGDFRSAFQGMKPEFGRHEVGCEPRSGHAEEGSPAPLADPVSPLFPRRDRGDD